MSEKPIERLNYFNGQRLEADDLRLEQDYHVRIQRLLMKSLFTPGVAEGFEVSPIEGGKKVVVMPGLALDDLGRAIVLVNRIELQPQGRYLCVRYAERKDGVQGAECKVHVNGAESEQRVRWAGPGRITNEPDFFWRRDPPLADERELIIAELILKPDCTVEKVEYGARKQAVAAPLARVRPVSLEGEKDIDKNNSKVIRFHVAHARATKVTLHLQAGAFSTLHYTEMPRHNHSSDDETIAIGPATVDYSGPTLAASRIDGHTHRVTQMKTGGTDGSADGPHAHKVEARVHIPTGGNDPRTDQPLGMLIEHGVEVTERPDASPGQHGLFDRVLTRDKLPGNAGNYTNNSANLGGVFMRITEGAHRHNLHGNTDSVIETGPGTHTHDVQLHIKHPSVGASGIAARSGVPHLTFFRRLAVKVRHGSGNVVNCTDKILAQLKLTNPSAWSPPGILITSLDGGPVDPLTVNGTGPIRLDLIDGLMFEPDEFVPYEIELAVEGDGNGGCIQYNLYVE